MPRHRSIVPFSSCAAALGLLAGILAGCAAGDRDQGNNYPRSGVEPSSLVVLANNFGDSDANRFRDTTFVHIYLFSTEHPVPITADGAFSFRLESLNGEPIAEWRFGPEQAAAAVQQLGPGPAYMFELSLLDSTYKVAGPPSDRLEITEADLLVTFTPATPEGVQPRPLRGRPGAPLQVGPRSR